MKTAKKSIKQARRKANLTAYRVRDTVRTVRGVGVIKFVFPRGPNGKTAYSVSFANKRLGIIFHEKELVPGSSGLRHT